MLEESVRNWLLQLEIIALRTGKTSIEEVTDEEVTEEEREAFDRGLQSLKDYRDLVGPEKFSQTTFDVGHDD